MTRLINGTKYLTTQEVSAKANVTSSYIARLIKRGKLPALDWGFYLIPIAAVEEWMKNRRKAGRPKKTL